MDRWQAMPRRVFLDSSTLQTLLTFGEEIFDNVEPADLPAHLAGLVADVEALRKIFAVNQRANFEFALSAASLDEVRDKGDRLYLRWAFDVLDHWEACLAGYIKVGAFSGEGACLSTILDEPRFVGSLGAKDRILLKDAIALECDCFLTMEKKLPKHDAQLRQAVGLAILRPPNLWELIRPWAALYY